MIKITTRKSAPTKEAVQLAPGAAVALRDVANKVVDRIIAKRAAVATETAAAMSKTAPQGLAKTKAKALLNARAAFVAIGVDDPAAYAVRKTARGEYWWGPANAPEAQPAPDRSTDADVKRAQAAKAAAKPAAKRSAPKAMAAKRPKADKGGAPSPTAAEALRLLQRKNGATAAEIAEKNGWLLHTTRAWIATYPRKVGLKVTKSKVAGKSTVYKIAA